MFLPFIVRSGLMLMFQGKLKTLFFMDITVSILVGFCFCFFSFFFSNNRTFKSSHEGFRDQTVL